jgi:predicted N-acetyltransferase YhbS
MGIEGPHGRDSAEHVQADRQVVGTTATISYGQRIAWIGMVLVDVEQRRRGIGRALLTHALAYLERRGVRTVALDSTPEGQPLYASLGFVDAYELERWRGPLHDDLTLQSSPDVRLLTTSDLPGVIAYDARLFGVERGHILGALQAGHPAGCYLAERAGALVGYALSRPGARAWHLGPLAADDPETAEHLARAAIAERARSERPASPDAAAGPYTELVLDVVRPNQHAVMLAKRLELAPVRRFIRMTRGAPPPTVDTERLYSSAGPELG